MISTVCERNILRGLNTGNYSLNWPSTTLARQVMAVLHSYLKSHETFRLNNSFKVNAKVLSLRHASELEKRNPRFRKDIHYGARGKDLRPRKERWQFGLGESGDQNNCLLNSLVVAYYNCLYMEDTNRETFLKMKKIQCGSQKQKLEAMMLINNETKNLAQSLGVSLQGPHTLETVAPLVNEHWNCQIHLFNMGTKKWHTSFPLETDDTKKQFYLIGSLSNEEIEHVAPIENIWSFYNKYGKYCRYCRVTCTGNNYEHRCRKINYCNCCHRKFADQATYLNKVETKFYCLSKMDSKEPRKCEKCNMLVHEACIDHHLKKVCSRGFTCNKCEVFTPANRKSVEEIKKYHVCGERTPCKLCDEPMTNNHLCRLNEVMFQKEHTNLGFLQCESIKPSMSCHKCEKNQETCDKCEITVASEYDTPNLLVFYYEHKKRGYFKRKIFSDFSLSEHIKNSIDHFSAETILPNEIKNNPMSEVSWPVQYGKSAKKTIDQELFVKRNMTVIDKFLDYIVKRDFRNTTVLIHGGQSYEMHFLAKALALSGLKPKTIVKNQAIMSLDFSQGGVRFIDCDNYLDMSIFQLSCKHHMDYIFFPGKLNTPNYYNYSGKVPSRAHWAEPQDYGEYKDKKEEFINFGLEPNNWVWKDQIVKHCNQKVLICIKATCEYIRLCIQTQQFFYKEIKNAPQPKRGELKFFHPFNQPLMTRAGYNYKLMRLFFKEDLKDVKIIKHENGVYFTSSKKELEWVSYRRHIEQNSNEFIFAFSPHGQKTCSHKSELVPDFKFKESIGLFQGCVHHRHDRNTCSIMRGKKDLKLYGKTDEEVRAEDQRKLKEYLKNHKETKTVVTIFECQWIEMKKHDPAVKDFMENHYCNYPPFRLNPRSAGNICYLFMH